MELLSTGISSSFPFLNMLVGWAYAPFIGEYIIESNYAQRGGGDEWRVSETMKLKFKVKFKVNLS